MTTKRALLLLITIFACVSLVEGQSPNPSPSASPEASASPAKKRGRKKAETSPSPSVSPEASASPAKTRGHKKAETSLSPMASPEASASPAKTGGHKKTEARRPRLRRRRLPVRWHRPRRQNITPQRRLHPRRRLKVVQPQLTLHRPRAVAMEWYGSIPIATSITRKVRVITAKPSRANT